MRTSLNIFGVITICLTVITAMGCTSLGNDEGEGFTYKTIPIAKESAQAGEGASIQFRGTALQLSGEGIQEGQSLRSVKVAKGDLSLLDIAETKGTVRIINVVPSLDTKVCEQQTHYLSEKSEGLDQQVTLMTISVDTPFAQARFAKEAHIDNVVFLSDYRGGQFGKTYGLLLEGPHLLTRAIMVVDQNNVIRHLQITPDLGQLPDLDTAFQKARTLLHSA